MKTPQELFDIAPAILSGAKDVAYDRIYNVKGIRRVYYVGGALCIDYVEKLPSTNYILKFNLDEKIIFHNLDTKKDTTYLLSISDLKDVFEIYLKVKGETSHFKNSYQKSCIKHLITDYDGWIKQNVK